MAVINLAAVESLQPDLLALGTGELQVLVNHWQSRERPLQPPRPPILWGPSRFSLKDGHPPWVHFPEACPCISLVWWLCCRRPWKLDAGQFSALT